jgi:hypothetical protein
MSVSRQSLHIRTLQSRGALTVTRLSTAAIAVILGKKRKAYSAQVLIKTQAARAKLAGSTKFRGKAVDDCTAAGMGPAGRVGIERHTPRPIFDVPSGTVAQDYRDVDSSSCGG